MKLPSRFRFFSTFFLFLFLFVHIGCDIAVVDNNPETFPYRSRHFIIYYDTSYYTPTDIELIGLRKEKLLKRINSYLETSYDRTVEVIISDVIENTQIESIERICETPLSIENDNGFTLARIITDTELGNPHWRFLSSGIAIASEVLPDNVNAFSRFKTMIKESIQQKPGWLDTVMTLMKDAIVDSNAFQFTSFEYSRAGAFMHYLKQRFGISALKQWYIPTLPPSSFPKPRRELIRSFNEIFRISIDSVITDFSKELQK
ncbi:MAG: hypothetical protein JW795_12645 [Chitinivibrionales bacterium]|nr:hypothetical protein [Chitinivibrionales bacterium]